MTLWHLADIHFGKVKQETIEDFYKVTDGLDNPDKIIIAGDLFHSSYYFEDETTRNVLFFVDYLLSKCPDVSFTKGTHSHDRSNLLTLKDIFKDRIEVYQSPTDEGGFCFVPEPTINTIEETIKMISSTDAPHLVYHGDIESAKYPSGVNAEDKSSCFLRKSLFKKFALVMAGHIHSNQRLKGTSIYYTGSLGRFQFGEEEDKGFYVHSLVKEKWASVFIPVKSPAYKTYGVENDTELEALIASLDNEEPVRVLMSKSRQKTLTIPKFVSIEANIDRTPVTSSKIQELAASDKPMYDKVITYIEEKMQLETNEILKKELSTVLKHVGV